MKHKELYQEIGSRVRQAREDKGLSQDEVSEALGIGRAGISNIEYGRAQLSVGDLIDLSAILEKPIAWLLKGDSGEPES